MRYAEQQWTGNFTTWGIMFHTDAVIAAAEERERKEQKMRERIESGEMTVDILDLRPTLQRLGMG